MLDTQRQQHIRDLFNDALELARGERGDFVDRIAIADASAADELRDLIAAHEQSTGFLEDPTVSAWEKGASIGQTIGRYKLLRLIGEGGFGSVYLAEQREPVARSVALKIIKPGMDTRQVVARFEAERQALAMMKHPSIATVLDAGATAQGRPYFVMEFVDGVSITEYCDQNSLSIEDRLDLVIQVCGAVQHAHTKGVIHRDIKPNNLLVTMNEGSPLLKVIDFGIAKAATGRLSDMVLTSEGRRVIGTPQYMSPEQADESAMDIDTRTDVYSLGVVLYELLAGVPPFDEQRARSADVGEWRRIIRQTEPLKPSTRLSSLDTLPNVASRRLIEPRRLPARISGDLDWITLKAMDKDRERRYGSAADFAADLRRHLSHEPVLASPPGIAYRAAKFIRRHRVGVLASCLVAMAALCGAVGLAVGLVQARESAEQARDAAQQAQAVNDFMREILTSVKPEQDGADVRLVEVMDDASAVAAQRFAGLPMLEAQVRDLLGGVYYDLTMAGKAKAEYKRAMELWQHHAGPDDPRTLTSEQMYVGSAINNQQVSEVESRLPALAQRTARVFGPNDPSTLDLRRTIGVVHMLHGRIDEAERIFLDVRSRLLAHGDDDGVQIRTLRNLIRLDRTRSSGADYDTRAAIVARIEPLARELVARAARAYGPASLIALDARIKWAEMLTYQRQYDAAARECREILDAASDRLGECHFLRLEAFDVLADAAHRGGDSATAAELKLERIRCLQADDDVLALIVTISDALPILDRGGRWVEGEALARELFEKLQAMGGGHGDMSFDTEIWVARFVSLLGRLDEADSMFRSLLASTEKVDLTANVRARAHLFHGGNLCRRGEFEESESELRTAADTLVDFRLGTRNRNPDDVLVEFMRLYEAWGKPEKADEYRLLREQTLANLPMDPS